MSNVFEIKRYDFSDYGRDIISMEKKGHDWPIVYMLTNSESIYIGETNSAVHRVTQHLQNPAKKKYGLQKIDIIFDETFNKSAILDIEQNLIQYFGADNKYKILNKNGGQSAKHNYYQRETYMSKFDLIWEQLRKIGLANSNISDIRNSDLFKYSPYNTLTEEQDMISKDIIYDMMDKLKKGQDGTAIINGGAGTGKTIVLINMIYKLINACKMDLDEAIDDPELSDYVQFIHDINEFISVYKGCNKDLKIAYISPMTSLRATMKKVFDQIGNGLKGSFVFGPLEIVTNVCLTKEKFDIVFVDEAHRLAKRKNIGYFGFFDKAAKNLGLDPNTSNLLDFIVQCSKYRVLVYDKKQTVKGSDISDFEFLNSLQNSCKIEKNLTTQMRCLGGNSYINYVTDILNVKLGLKKQKMADGYDFKIFYDANKMINKIKELNNQYELCRNVCSQSFPRISKGLKYEEALEQGKWDIIIGDGKYIWNTCIEGWIISENAINEIGCIHTVQGYDLNYVGLIFGKEIDYDENLNRIVIDRKKLLDKNIQQGVDDITFYNYVINAYKVIMTRGIRGCYVYAYNKGLRNYLSRFIDESN